MVCWPLIGRNRPESSLYIHTERERERNNYFFPPAKQGFTRVSFFFFFQRPSPKNVPLFSFNDKKSLIMFFSIPFLFLYRSLSLSIEQVWDVCSCWSQLKSLILFLRETIPLEYKFNTWNQLFSATFFLLSLLFLARVVETYFLRFLSFFFSFFFFFFFSLW